MKDITFHYTSESMAKDVVALLDLEGDVLDAGSGKNKVWQKQVLNCKECELEDGCNFYEWSEEVDWVIGNPPYHESWKFTEKALTIARKGVAWLLNNQALNSHFTPRRIRTLQEKGWNYTLIHVVADKRWFGRYYFIVLEKKDALCKITSEPKTY